MLLLPLTEKSFFPTAAFLEDGIGGGVCQVSSTLFNAALLANLKITERCAHSLPAAYIAKGRDATVYYGAIDFSFVNSLSLPVQLKAEAKNGVLTVSVWGDQSDKTDNMNIWVEKSGEYYILYRAVNGDINYSAKSKYENQ